MESLGKNEYVRWVSNFNEYAIVIFNDAIVFELRSSDWDHDDLFHILKLRHRSKDVLIAGGSSCYGRAICMHLISIVYELA